MPLPCGELVHPATRGGPSCNRRRLPRVPGLTRLVDVNALTVTALAGSVVAAGLVVGMLFDGWLEELLPQPRARVAQLAAGAALAGAVYAALRALADTAR